jgi:hypothetical protein
LVQFPLANERAPILSFASGFSMVQQELHPSENDVWLQSLEDRKEIGVGDRNVGTWAHNVEFKPQDRGDEGSEE